MIPFVVLMILIGSFVSIRKKSILPVVEVTIYAIPMVLYEVLKYQLSALSDNWVVFLLLPMIIGMIVFYLSIKLVNRLDFNY